MNVPAGSRTTPVPDPLGSVVGSLDAGTGNLTKFAYLPYGRSVPTPSPFGFTGQRTDPEAGGLYYYRARHYSPGLGRFFQADPIGYDGGINLYAYAGNDPLNMLDPDGLAVRQAVESFAARLYQDTFLKAADDIGRLYERSMSSPLESLSSVLNSFPQTRLEGGIASAVGAAGATFGITRSATGAVASYEVGAFNNLRARSAVGDSLDIHHVIQASPAQQVISNYNRSTGPAITLPRIEHQAIPVLTGSYSGTARDLLATDIRNLRNYTNAPNRALQELIILNKTQYPATFAR